MRVLEQLQDVLSPLTLEKGEKYFRSGNVLKLRKAAGNIVVTVRGSQGHNRRVILDADDPLDLEFASCTCHEYDDLVCKHIVAAMLAYEAMRPAGRSAAKKAPAKPSDENALQLLEFYTDQITNQKLTETIVKADAILEPTLNNDENGRFNLTFRAGKGRLYVIKDVYDLRDRLRNTQYLSLGREKFVVEPAAFEPASRPLLNFLLRFLPQHPVRPEYAFYYSFANLKKQMFLDAIIMDEFFSVMLGRTLKIGKDFFEYGDPGREYTVKAGDPQLRLRVERQDGGLKMSLGDACAVVSGREHLYIFAEDAIFVTSPEYCQACRGLMRHALGKELFFDAEGARRLQTTVLREAAPYIEIVGDALEDYEPPEMKAKVWLDMERRLDEDGDEERLLTARAEFSYGKGKAVVTAFLEKEAHSLDVAAELLVETLLLRYFGNRLLRPGVLMLPYNEEAVFLLASEGVAAISELAEVYASEEFKKLRFRPPVAVSVGVRVQGNLLDVEFDLGGLDSEITQILSAYKRRRKYYRMKDGSFLSLENEGLGQLAEMVDGLGLDEKDLKKGEALLSLNRAPYLDSVLKQGEGLRYESDAAFRGIVRNLREAVDADFTIPESLSGVLRNYQKTGYRWLRTLDFLRFGGILADDMGLGKTLQVLALIQAERQESGEKCLPSIVVCPASLVLNWESETRRFTPELRPLALVGGAAERKAAIAGLSPRSLFNPEAAPADILVTSYDQLKRDLEHYAHHEFSYIVLDEAQYIKNQNTQNAKAVKALQGRTRLALTGTPVENSLAELWSIFDFLMPGYLGHYNHFRNKYESPIVKSADETALGRLRSLVRPFLLRRLKGEVLKELPPKTESVLPTEMLPEQRKIYNATLAEVRQELAVKLKQVTGAQQQRFIILAALTRLRQICCDPALLYENYRGGSAKLDACLELIGNCLESGHRLLLFSQFTSMLGIIGQRLTDLGTPFYLLQGSTPKTERQRLVNAFNSGDAPVFLISLKAGGTGLNLTGADTVVHYDPWWNLSAQNQATDRAHRIGQQQHVSVYKLIAKGTIEERIMDMQEKKAALAASVVQEGEGVFDQMSGEELMALLADR
ncbi:MAG: DEAD/DEAH box helicase [Gracilibacteraceae bacterium]|jgi:superfamily II DNA or RNA helicase|nr:DEAD/DEAH box helicase [Gracilibacteraceae bacterium]